MKNKHIFIPLFVFLGACVVSLIASIIDYTAVNPALAYSSETIQFNYDGASDGLDPNGNLFDPVGFLSDEVIEKALTKSELTYSVDDVRPYIAMENVVPQNILEELNAYEKVLSDGEGGRNITSKDYHPVRYRFVVYQKLDNKLSKGKLNELVDNIVDEYNETFYATYKKSFSEQTYDDTFDMDGYDYIYQNQIYVSKIKALMNYADTLYQERNDFVATIDDTNRSFKDVYLIAKNYIDNNPSYTSKIEELIVNNALSKDVDRLKDYYNYLIEQIDFDIHKYSDDLDSVMAQIGTKTPGDTSDDYKINPTVYVGTGDNVIKVQDETAATYNTLLNEQVSISSTIASLNKQKTEYQTILDILNSSSGDATAEARVKQMLVELDTNYQELKTLLNELIDAYNAKYLKEGVVAKSDLRYNNTSIISSSFIVRAIKVAAPIMLATMFGIAVFYIVWVIIKDKKVA